MSVIQNNLLLAGDDAYNLTRSLRFRSSASAYLNRTPASAGNRKTWTYSTWIKRGALGSAQGIFSCVNGQSTESNLLTLLFLSNDTLQLSSLTSWRVTTQVFRDPSAWYHIVLAWDTTQATGSNRVKIYVNGVQITSFGTSNDPSLNLDGGINQAFAHAINRDNYASNNWFDGYTAETHFIDGQALTPSSFGATNASTGVWQPKKYAGTYGTNGFYLPFTNNSTTTTLGNDFSGNGNNWTTNNISLTAGSTYDSMTDVPTLTSATASNFCTLNPLSANASFSIVNALSNANLQTSSSTSNTVTLGTMGMATNSNSKYYCEFVLTVNGGGAPIIGLASAFAQTLSGTAPCVSYRTDGRVEKNGTTQTTTTTWTTNDVIGMAVDLTVNDGQVTFYKNNTSIYTLTGLITQFGSNDIFFGCQTNAASTTTFVANFGQRPFAYTPPTGFVALNTFNLPTPTIGATASTQANKNFDINVWTGNTSTQTITNSGGFQPDLVWIKNRSSARFHNLYNSVSGLGKRLFSNATDAEQTITAANYLSSFNSNGFSLGFDIDVNESPYSYVGWQWKAGGTGVTNTAGSITSTVSANTSAGFSIVTYTGTGANATVGHGLGVAPRMIFVKRRNSTGNWAVYTNNAGSDAIGFLNSNAAFSSPDSTYWNATGPTATVFSVGTNAAVNASGGTYVAYCFAQVNGFSSIGRYAGNGSSDGPFIYTGFRPRFVLYKKRDDVGGWIMYDTARDPSNVVDLILESQSSSAESSGSPFADIDFVSNGFKIRGTSSAINTNGSTYIYMAFASNPFKYSLGA